MLLDAKGIMAAKDKKTKIVPCPEWGGDVLLGVMGALDRAKMADWFLSLKEDNSLHITTTDSPSDQGEMADDKKLNSDEEVKYTMEEHTELMLKYLAATILDPSTYQPAFSPDNIEELGQKNPKILGILYKEALDLNADSEIEMEKIEKNSEGTTEKDSGLG